VGAPHSRAVYLSKSATPVGANEFDDSYLLSIAGMRGKFNLKRAAVNRLPILDYFRSKS
jgi:hypothetical protein